MIEGIRRGCNFPPVPVHKIDDGIFHISNLTRYLHIGGYHRAIAHFQAEVCLKCNLVLGPSMVPPDKLIDVTQIRLREMREHYKHCIARNKSLEPERRYIEINLS